MPCGQGHRAEFVSYRDKVIDTAPRGGHFDARAWYHCAACGHGFAPRDAGLGVAGASMSPGLAAMNDQAAATAPFAKAARLLEVLGGVRLTAKRVERAAEGSGAAVAAAVRNRASLVSARKLVPLPPSPLPDKLYAAIDGTGVPVTAKETAGRDGKGEDGRARPARSSSPSSSPRTRSMTAATAWPNPELQTYSLTHGQGRHLPQATAPWTRRSPRPAQPVLRLGGRRTTGEPGEEAT